MVGGGSGGGGNSTTVQKADPWEGQQSYLRDIFSQAQGLNQAGLSGNAPMYAAFDPAQQTALQLGEQRALAGSPLTNTAQANLQDIMSGGQGFVNLASPLYRQFQEVTAPTITSKAAMSGRYGSEAMNTGLSGARADFAEGLGRLGLQSASMAPQLAAQDYVDIGELSNIGATRQAQAQQALDEPYARLARYQAMIQGSPVAGGTTTGTSYQPKGSALGSGLGLGLGGAYLGATQGAGIAAALGSSLPWLYGGPAGALIGGGLGLLGGSLLG